MKLIKGINNTTLYLDGEDIVLIQVARDKVEEFDNDNLVVEISTKDFQLFLASYMKERTIREIEEMTPEELIEWSVS